MEWEFIAPMVMGVAFIVTTGGVLVLRPIAKRLGTLLEVLAREKAALPGEEVTQVRHMLESMHGRLSLLEERQDFTEALLNGTDLRRPRRVLGPSEEIPESDPTQAPGDVGG